MGYKIYGEEEPKESPIAEFILGFLLGSAGVYIGGAWVLVSMGWVSQPYLLSFCGFLGLLMGSKYGWASWRRKRKENS